MRKKYFYLSAVLLVVIGAASYYAGGYNEMIYVEASGMSVAPDNTKGVQAKALARRGAMVDLQRNMLESIRGSQSGSISGIEILKEEWDGKAYTVTGQIKRSKFSILIERVFGITM